MTRPNAFEAAFPADEGPDGYRSAEAPFGELAGGSELAVRLFELPPGQALCPYHYEYVEEWLLVLSGEVRVRVPDGVSAARAGDLICFPAGPAGAHKVLNESSEPARITMFSPATLPSVCVYPDSDKVGVWVQGERGSWMFRGSDGHLDYYDGEPAAGG